MIRGGWKALKLKIIGVIVKLALRPVLISYIELR